MVLIYVFQGWLVFFGCCWFLQGMFTACYSFGSNCSTHLPKALKFHDLIYMATLKQGETLIDRSVLMNGLSGTG